MEHGEVGRRGEAWYLVDREADGGWELREAIVTRTFGDQVVLAQQGISLQVDQHVLDAFYARTPLEAWRRAEARQVERLDALRAARAAWAEGIDKGT